MEPVRVRTPIGEIPASAVVIGNLVFWPVWTAAVGSVAQRTTNSRFDGDDVITRARPAERDGALYRETLVIDKWKDRLPEAGELFGGFGKRSLRSADPELLEQFLIETRRAEHAHWGMAAGFVVTLIWNPWWASGANAVVATASNLPCIAVQRYNRIRLRRALDAVRRRATSSR